MPTDHDNGKNLSPEQGQLLVKLARQTLMERLGRKVAQDEIDSLNAALKDPCFKISCGTFVTLTLNGQLRGCIGNLTSGDSVVNGVRRNAVNAAFHDPRFAPLNASELELIKIEVSVLAEPQPLNYQDSDDLLKKLRPGVDGVIISLGHASATFLPQVWEQLPAARDFLAHLCMKAGLRADAWKKSKPQVSIYQVQYFEEP